MWLIRSEEETDERFGKHPEKRTIEELIENCVIIVDKHSGPTSHQITHWIKQIFNVKKTDHSGTLDPKVTGVLPVALENATKVMPALTHLDKEYVGIMHLHKDVPLDVLRETASQFVGKIKQVPPVRAAVKRAPRERTIYFFDILELKGRSALFHVGCEAGTYIRKLIHDMGLKIGGAHMKELRRIKVGDFTEDKAHSLLEIKDAYERWKEGKKRELKKILIPVEHAVLHLKKVFVKDTAIYPITNGAPVFVGGITRIEEGIIRGELVGIFSLKSELIALGIARMTSEEMHKRKRGIAVRTDRVIMKKGTYPDFRKVK
jgi:H/ACA ribonucleoprotein complex subunit 4